MLDAHAASCSSLLRRHPFLAEGVRQCLHAPQRLSFGFLPDPGGDLAAAASTPGLDGDSAVAGANHVSLATESLTRCLEPAMFNRSSAFDSMAMAASCSNRQQRPPEQKQTPLLLKAIPAVCCAFTFATCGRGSDGSRACSATSDGWPRICAGGMPSHSHSRDDQLSSGPDPASCAAALGAAKLAAVALWQED